jgi:hemolysin-activating ACP:hemolysin acyltransferase
MNSSGTNKMDRAAIVNVANGAPRPALRLYQPGEPTIALGLAVSHLMTRAAFARLRFGEWSRILVGQINRRHYRFVLDDKDRVVGFFGWALATREAAEAWVEGRSSSSHDTAKDGECIIFNAWTADTIQVNRFLLDAARRAMLGKETAYFKRLYKDGRTRPVRVNVNEFVADHISRPGGARTPSSPWPVTRMSLTAISPTVESIRNVPGTT